MLEAVMAAYITGAAQVANFLATNEGGVPPQSVQAGVADACKTLQFSRGLDIPAMVRG